MTFDWDVCEQLLDQLTHRMVSSPKSEEETKEPENWITKKGLADQLRKSLKEADHPTLWCNRRMNLALSKNTEQATPQTGPRVLTCKLCYPVLMTINSTKSQLQAEDKSPDTKEKDEVIKLFATANDSASAVTKTAPRHFAECQLTDCLKKRLVDSFIWPGSNLT